MPEMAKIATQMVHDVLNAFVERDAETALRVIERDKAVDDFYNSIFRTLLTYMMETRTTSASRRTCCSSPRMSSGSAIMRPTSPRWSIMPQPAAHLDRPKGDEMLVESI